MHYAYVCYRKIPSYKSIKCANKFYIDFISRILIYKYLKAFKKSFCDLSKVRKRFFVVVVVTLKNMGTQN